MKNAATTAIPIFCRREGTTDNDSRVDDDQRRAFLPRYKETMNRWLLVMTFVACSREPSKVALVTEAAASTPKKCLPVVAASCGCVYSCGVGTEVSPGEWSVDHPFWAPNRIKAKIAPWCVSGDCTDAFHGEIVCSGICPPKPAVHGCHFEGDRCLP